MRRRTSAVWLAGSLAFASLTPGCSEESVQAPPAPPANFSPQLRMSLDAGPIKATELEHAAAARYSKALSSPAFAGLGDALNEDAHFAFAGMKDKHGRDKVVEAHEALFGAFDERRFVTTRIWLTDASQTLEWTLTGVHAKTWMGVPATEKPVAIHGITLRWTNDDGSITDVHVAFDEAMVKTLLGVGPRELVALPTPPAPGPGSPDVIEQGKTADEAANVHQVRTWLSTLERGDEAGYLATVTDDVEVVLLQKADSERGKTAMRTHFKALRKRIAELDMSIDNVWAVQGFVIVEYFVIGAQMAPIGVIPLEHDRLLKLSVVDVVTRRTGKIARVRRYDNPLQALSSP